MKDKMILALLLGIISFSGNAFAAVKPTEAIPSKILDVTLTRNKITSIPDVVYEQVPQRGYPSRAMKMDLFIPETKDKKPLILYIPGGGFISANKNNMPQLVNHLAEQGYVVAAVEYRVAPTVKFPAPLEDIKAALRFLRAHQDQYGIDPQRVGVVGGSAGG